MCHTLDVSPWQAALERTAAHVRHGRVTIPPSARGARKVTSRVTWQSRRPGPLNEAPRRQQGYPHQQTNEPTHGRRHSFWQALRRGHDVGYEARRQERICEGDHRRTEPPSRNATTPG